MHRDEKYLTPRSLELAVRPAVHQDRCTAACLLLLVALTPEPRWRCARCLQYYEVQPCLLF